MSIKDEIRQKIMTSANIKLGTDAEDLSATQQNELVLRGSNSSGKNRLSAALKIKAPLIPLKQNPSLLKQISSCLLYTSPSPRD